MSLFRSPGKIAAGGGSQPDLSKISGEMVDSQMTYRKRKQPIDRECECKPDIQELRKELSHITDLLEKFVGSQEQNMKIVKENILDVKNEIADIKLTTSNIALEQNTIKTHLNQLDSKISCDEEKLKPLESELIQLKNILPTTSSPAMAQSGFSNNEQIILELQERNNREKNILLLGLPEFPSSNVVESRLKDQQDVWTLISTTFKDIPKPIKIFRIGKYNQNKSRVIKVCFTTSEPVKFLLKNKAKLPKEIKVYSDQTPCQQKYLKNVREELARRQQNGESNLIIKYVKNIPTILNSIPKN